MTSTKKQRQDKRRGRGRPFPPGVSGNWKGRPRGSLNKLSLAVREGVKQALEEIPMPERLDESRPFESWDGVFIQDGLKFNKVTLEPLPLDGPRPEQPAELDPRERYTKLTWENQRVCLQNGWAYDPVTWMAIKL